VRSTSGYLPERQPTDHRYRQVSVAESFFISELSEVAVAPTKGSAIHRKTANVIPSTAHGREAEAPEDGRRNGIHLKRAVTQLAPMTIAPAKDRAIRG
jgi:hypothetical protein